MNTVIQNILERRSVRKFEQKPIPEEILKQVLLAGVWAPSGRNQQLWQFTVLRRRDHIQRLAKAVGNAAEMGDGYCFYDGPCHIIISCPKGYRNSAQDCCAAAENILLASHSLGIASCWINQIRTTDEDPAVRSVLTEYGVPSDHHVEVSIAMGYGAQKPEPHERRQNTVVYFD